MRGWSAMCEELVLTWHAHPTQVSRDELIAMMAASLPAVVAAVT